MEASETKHGDLVHNGPEAKLIERLAAALLMAGVPGVTVPQTISVNFD